MIYLAKMAKMIDMKNDMIFVPLKTDLELVEDQDNNSARTTSAPHMSGNIDVDLYFDCTEDVYTDFKSKFDVIFKDSEANQKNSPKIRSIDSDYDALRVGVVPEILMARVQSRHLSISAESLGFGIAAFSIGLTIAGNQYGQIYIHPIVAIPLMVGSIAFIAMGVLKRRGWAINGISERRPDPLDNLHSSSPRSSSPYGHQRFEFYGDHFKRIRKFDKQV